jgi:hypothetical protein
VSTVAGFDPARHFRAADGKGQLFAPQFVRAATHLSLGAKCVYERLHGRMGKNTHCWPSADILAKDVGVSVRTIWKYVQELESAGLVERIASPGGRQAKSVRGISNRYLLLKSPIFPDGTIAFSPVSLAVERTPKRRLGVKPSSHPKPVWLCKTQQFGYAENDSLGMQNLHTNSLIENQNGILSSSSEGSVQVQQHVSEPAIERTTTSAPFFISEPDPEPDPDRTVEREPRRLPPPVVGNGQYSDDEVAAAREALWRCRYPEETGMRPASPQTRELLANFEDLADFELYLEYAAARRIRYREEGYGLFFTDAKNWPSMRADAAEEHERRARRLAELEAAPPEPAEIVWTPETMAEADRKADEEMAELARLNKERRMKAQQQAEEDRRKREEAAKNRCQRCMGQGTYSEDDFTMAWCDCPISTEVKAKYPEHVAKWNQVFLPKKQRAQAAKGFRRPPIQQHVAAGAVA